MTTYDNAAVASTVEKTLAVGSCNTGDTSEEHSKGGENADHVGRW